MAPLDLFFVLIPDENGELNVCPLDQVVDAVLSDDDDRERLLETIANDCSVDGMAPTPENIRKVRQFNLTGDAVAYWKTENEKTP